MNLDPTRFYDQRGSTKSPVEGSTTQPTNKWSTDSKEEWIWSYWISCFKKFTVPFSASVRFQPLGRRDGASRQSQRGNRERMILWTPTVLEKIGINPENDSNRPDRRRKRGTLLPGSRRRKEMPRKGNPPQKLMQKTDSSFMEAKVLWANVEKSNVITQIVLHCRHFNINLQIFDVHFELYLGEYELLWTNIIARNKQSTLFWWLDYGTAWDFLDLVYIKQ